MDAIENMQIVGAKIYYTSGFTIFGRHLIITETQVNSWIVILLVSALCFLLTRGLKVKPTSKRQIIAEFLVEKATNFVKENMGAKFEGFAPFIAALMALSAFSSLMSIFRMYAPTSDLNTIAGWAILVFFLITYYKIKGGLGGYLKSFTQPIFILTPFNIIGELATPISMMFRHFGNIVSGSVIMTLIYAALSVLSAAIFGWLPGFLGRIPFFQVGIPVVLSAYFDIFSGLLQAFIFAMLTMMYVSSAAEDGEASAEARRARKLRRQNKKIKQED